MKILSLQFKNLNSLYGEWLIDFTQKNYSHDGLFVLSGPTGAGKSTILDAICLALYGQTPRLGRITQSSNEVMSKNTAECYSLLCFESKGNTYYARFEQRRARNKADGKLQDVERSIAKDNPGNIICQKKTEANDEIIRITGMDFSRFTRSILLAQGAFDSFLKARDEEKSILLEQITGRKIYSEISRKIFERARLEKEKLTELSIKIENTKLLSDEEIKTLDLTLKNNAKSLQELAVTLKTLGQHIAWLNNITALQEKITCIQNDYQKFLNQKEQSKEQKINLEKAQKAEKLLAPYAIIRHQEQELQANSKSLQEISTSIPQKEERLNTIIEHHKKTIQEYLEKKKQLELQKPLFEKVKALDILLETKNKQLQEITGQKKDEEKKYSALQKELKTKNTEIVQAEQQEKELVFWIEKHGNTEILKQECSAIKQNLEQLEIITKNGKQLKERIDKHNNELEQQTKTKQEKTAELEKLEEEIHKNIAEQQENCNSLQNLLNGKLLREYEASLNHLEEKRLFLLQIASLEEQRKRLQQDKECPLCGSTHHPFTESSNIQKKQDDSIEKEIKEYKHHIEKIKNLETKQSQLDIIIKKDTEKQAEFTQSMLLLEKQLQEKEIFLQELQTERQGLLNSFQELKQILEKQLRPFSVQEITAQNTAEILQTLQSSITIWDTKQKAKQDIALKIQEQQKILASLQAQKENIQKYLEQKQNELNQIDTIFQSMKKERLQLFAEKNPIEEENCLLEHIGTSEENKEKIQKEKEIADQELIRSKEQINQLSKNIAAIKNELDKNIREFSQLLSAQEFSSKEEFLSACLPKEKQEQLEQFFEELEKNLHSHKKQLDELNQALQQEMDKKPVSESIELLLEQEEQAKAKQTQLLIEQGEIQGKLSQNQEYGKQFSQDKQDHEIQLEICKKWDSINQFIGSSDGKKYRTIAQGITFEYLIAYANSKLQSLQKRYLLVRDEQEPLSLNILDNYQGSERRSVQNLSGGESFIVSLSLALGLAQMASQNVQVDSLFLDEGFGTLDEDSLDTALATLTNIQQEGKLIGIISHIPLLKERINTQINVIPQSGGRSIIEGIGCKKLH